MKDFHIVVYSAEEGGYYAQCTELEGCFTQGETLGEIKSNMEEAIKLCLEESPEIQNVVDFLCIGIACA